MGSASSVQVNPGQHVTYPAKPTNKTSQEVQEPSTGKNPDTDIEKNEQEDDGDDDGGNVRLCFLGGSYEEYKKHVKKYIEDEFYSEQRGYAMAYGNIHFFTNAATSYYTPSYVCVANKDTDEPKMKSLMTLITRKKLWNRKHPELVVSILGGMKNATNSALDRVQTGLQRSLHDLAMASTKGTWVLTPGTHVGVAKLIGSAVKEYIAETGSSKLEDVVLLGVVSYHSIAGGDSLRYKNKEVKAEERQKQVDNSVAAEDDMTLETEDAFTAEYQFDGTIQPKENQNQLIDPNHSLFVMVDDNPKKEPPETKRDKFGGELDWRIEFEKFLCESSGKDEVPVVSVLLDGGPTAMEACAHRLEFRAPLVVVKGSGRAADLIAELCEKSDEWQRKDKSDDKKFLGEMMKLCRQHLPKQAERLEGDEEEKKKTFGYFKKIIEAIQDDMVLVLNLTQIESSSSDGLLQKLLEAIQIYNRKRETPPEVTYKNLLSMSLEWNRPDLAAKVVFGRALGDTGNEVWSNKETKKKVETQKEEGQKIIEKAAKKFSEGTPTEKKIIEKAAKKFSEGTLTEKKSKIMCQVALTAMVENNAEFVQMLLDNGLKFSEFVYPGNLYSLYIEILGKKENHFARFIDKQMQNRKVNKDTADKEFTCQNDRLNEDAHEKKHNIHARYIAETIEDFLEDAVHISACTIHNIQTNKKKNDMSANKKDKQNEEAARHLFLWAVLFNQKELAELIWRHTSDHIAGAIVAAVALKNLSERAKDHEGADISEDYMESSKYFQKLAEHVLDRCWTDNRLKTSQILTRVSHSWGGCTALGLAYRGSLEEFMAQPACASKLQKIMYGDLSVTTSFTQVLLAAFMPLAVCRLKFVRSSDTAVRLDECDGKNQLLDVSPCCSSSKEATIAYPNAVYRAFCAPIVKCIHYTVYSLAFLTFFAIFMMTELSHDVRCTETGNTTIEDVLTLKSCLGSPYDCLLTFVSCHWAEIATLICMANNIIDELRQFTRSTGDQNYFKEWWRDSWNLVDLCSYLLFIGAYFARIYLDEKYFDVVLILFSLSFLLNIMRFYQLFYISEKLGPKVTMILGMLIDLALFLVILSFTVLAFGVINQTILDHKAEFNMELLNKVIFRPYFQMYGELFLEDYTHTDEGLGYKWIILGIFMIITNVLLLNLLIAIFSFTFDKVQSKADMLWRYNYYAVVYEHFDRPRFPLLEALIKLFINCGKNCRGQKDSEFRRDFGNTGDKDDRLTDFIRKRMEEYVTGLREDKTEEVVVTSRLDQICRQNEQMNKKIELLMEKLLPTEDKAADKAAGK